MTITYRQVAVFLSICVVSAMFVSARPVTAQEPLRLLGSSLTGRNVMKCRDTVAWRFSRPIDAGAALSDTAVALYNYETNTTVPCTSWIAPDRRIVYTLPLEPLVPRQNYRLQARFGALPGYESALEVQEFFTIAGAYSVYFSTRIQGEPDAGTDELDPWLPADETVVRAGEREEIHAYRRIGSLRFSHWASPQFGVLDDVDTTEYPWFISFSQPCERLKDVHLTAVYERIPGREIDIIVDTSKVLDFRIVHYNLMLGSPPPEFYRPGVYTLFEDKYEYLEVFLIPKDGVTWRGWASDSASEYNNAPPQYITTIRLAPRADGSVDPITFLRAVFDGPVGVGETSGEQPGMQVGVSPHPVEQEAELRYRVDRTAHVRAVLRDVTGAEADVLVDDVRQPGVHVVQWKRGALSPGIYFCTWTIGENSSVQPVILR